MLRIALLAIAFPLSAFTKPAQTIFAYKTKPARDSHYLILNETEGKLEASYIGSHHGDDKDVVWFFRAPITDFKKTESGEVSFTIGERELCAKPFKASGKEKPQTCSQSTKEPLTYKGKLSPEELHLTCQSKHGDCWSDDFFFKKTK